MTDKLELKSSHEVVYTVNVEDVESIFYCKPTDPDILTVLMKDGKRLYCDEVCPIDSLQEEPKFKVGDVIQKKDDNSIRYSIINRTDDTYRALRGLSETIVIWFSEQDQWELVEESIEKETPESWNEMLKEDTTHRTKADVDAAMADVEEKAKAFTEAHKGETADEILAGMRGEEPIIGILSRYLDHASKEEAIEVKSAIDRWFSECFPLAIKQNW